MTTLPIRVVYLRPDGRWVQSRIDGSDEREASTHGAACITAKRILRSEGFYGELLVLNPNGTIRDHEQVQVTANIPNYSR